MNNEFDGPVETIIAVVNDILDSEDERVRTKMLSLLDEKITNLNMQICQSNNRGNFHIGHIDIIRTLLHELRTDMQNQHNDDGTCQECALLTEFFTIVADDSSQTG